MPVISRKGEYLYNKFVSDLKGLNCDQWIEKKTLLRNVRGKKRKNMFK